MAFAALTIDVTAKLANLEQGLARAESQLTGFAKRAETAAAGLAAGFGALAGGLAVGAVVNQFAAAVEGLSALDDAAESTGASVEELSSILNTLAPTGVGLGQITDYATKLAKAMREAEDPTSAQAQAFKALGVATREADGTFRSTGAVLEDAARALAGYADGTNKTALAQVLLGKSGAEALPFLKDLATRTKEQATVSSEAAAEAEKLANAWRGIKRDAELAAQSIAAKIIPDLAKLAEQFRETGKAGGTFWDQIRGVLGPNKAIADLEKDLAGLQGQKDVAKRLGLSNEALADYDARIARVQKSIDALRPAQRAANGPSARELLFGNAGYGAADLPVAPRVSEAAAGSMAKARDAYAELDALVRQADIDDTLKREAEAAKQLAQQLERAADAALRRIADNDRAEQDAEKALRDEVDRVLDLTDATRALYRERDRLADLEAGGLSPDAANARRAQLNSQIDGILQGELPQATKDASDAARQLGLTFSSAFEDAVVGGRKLSDVLNGLASDVARLLLRKVVTEPLLEAAIGRDGKGGLFGELLGSVFGGARAAGGPVDAGRAYLVGEKGPELIVPRAPGKVLPAGSLGGMPVINQTIMVSGEVSRSDVYNAMVAAKEAAKAEIFAGMQRNGSFARA